MPAKPQQMADNQEKSDDLIAELAKLMASNAQGSEADPKQSVIKLTPLGDSTPSASAQPVRIPGMDAAKPAEPAAEPVASSAVSGSLRIPGMADAGSAAENPAPADPAKAAAAAPGAPEAETAPTEPGHEPVAETPAEPAPAPGHAARSEPSPEAAAAAFAQPKPVKTPFDSPILKKPGEKPATPEDEMPAAPAAADTANDQPGDGDFHFDFGLGGDTASPTGPEPEAAAPEEAAATERDPIADLIVAELDTAGDGASEAPADPGRTAAVEAVPARSFGNTTVQAPVLIGTPGSGARPAPRHGDVHDDGPSPHKQGADSFAVAPVFGLGSANPQPAPEPSSDGDPMSEIENLIGEAVRVELADPEEAQPAPSQQPATPVVPPLNTGFAPRRAGLRDVEPAAEQPAEAAILAAAAATGAEVGRIQAPAAEEGPYRRTHVKPPNTGFFAGGTRQVLGIGVAALLLLAAGFGLYWVLGMGRGGDPDTAPVLTADATPVKEAPVAATTSTDEVPRSVVFDELDGIDEADGGETLVSRDATAGSDVTDVARVTTPEITELANRKVRTVTVRPDGTIVSADDAVAGSEALPIERPNVPELPGAVQPSELLEAAAETTAAAADAAASNEPADDPIAALVAGSATASEPGSTDLAALDPAAATPEAEVPAVFDDDLAAPTPMPRPTDRNSLDGAGQGTASIAAPTSSGLSANEPASIPLVSLTGAETAATTPTTPAASASAPAAPVDAAAYVQLASLPTEADAQGQVAAMQSRWGSLFGGRSLVVQRAELGGGRVTYRLRLPTSTLDDATRICSSIRANGGDCFATNG